MINLIDELKVVPGVVGACIVNDEDGLLATNLPAIFKPERLTVVGQHLLKLSRSGHSCFPDLTDMTLNYDESVVVARELVDGTVLFAICDPSFNYNLLTMSFNLLQEEFKEGNHSQEPVAAPSVAEGPAASPGSGVSADLQELLDEMKGLLGKILGPMAAFVFDDVAEVWQGQGAADFSHIEDLISSINQEIDDPEKVDNYRRLIAPLLNNFQKG
jgi:predicted regulator of Ras-like GTPase activity (Roadblock/LC7/MglB family)